MLVMSDPKAEEKELQRLIESDPKLRTQHEAFRAEMDFKQMLIDARKESAMTQKDVSEASGLSQQAVSRLERGQGATIETVIKYLGSMGYRLGVSKITPRA